MAKGYVVEKNGKFATAAGGLGGAAKVYKTRAEAQVDIDGNNKLKGGSIVPADGKVDTNVAAAPGATGEPARKPARKVKKKAASGK